MRRTRPTHRTIAYYCESTHLGAGERGLLDLVGRIGELTAGWYRPWFILPQEEGPVVDQLVDLGVPYAVLPLPKGFLSSKRTKPLRSLVTGALAWPSERAYLGRLKLLIGDHRPALIHSTGIRCHALAARLEAGVPVVWHLREIIDQGAVRIMLRRLSRAPEVHLLSNSYATAMALEPDEAQPIVVYDGIDTSRFVPAKDPIFRERFRIPDAVPIIGAVGVIQRGKGLEDFVEMAAALHGSGFEARYVIVGDEIHGARRDEGLKSELENRVDQLGIAAVFQFIGFHQDSVRVMQGLDLLVSASTVPESFDRLLVEAMACGVPVVASALGGSLEIIDDQVCGRLFAPSDLESLAGAVLDLLTDRELCRRCVAAGRQRAIQRFDVDSYVAGLVRTYDRILIGA